jgi:hypothetical protein
MVVELPPHSHAAFPGVIKVPTAWLQGDAGDEHIVLFGGRTKHDKVRFHFVERSRLLLRSDWTLSTGR